MTLSGDDAPWLDVEVSLDAGFPLRRIESPSHDVQVRARAGGARQVVLSRGPVVADRDFRLRWQPELGHAPTSALFEETFEGERYALLMVLPPDPERDDRGVLPKEAIFVIDTSGSMSGTSIAQARSSLAIGLGSLAPRDSFNVIAFDDSARSLFPEPLPASTENVTRALEWVRRLDADGGTEMLSALSLALRAAGPSAAGRVRQVVFVTDGSVGNEDQVLGLISRQLTDQRLFTVGIGSAPNRYFMRGAARFGRGSFTEVATLSEVGEKMNGLWTRLAAPVMTELSVEWQPGSRVESFPSRLPDLYRGEPLVLVARLPSSGSPSLTLSGRRSGRDFRTSLAGTSGKAERGIHRLWARRKIEELMDSQIAGAGEESVQPAVIAVALQHGLVSRYTSLVAVDDRKSVDGPGREVAVPLAVPDGNSMFGSLPQTATPGPFCLLFGVLSLASAWMIGRASA
jgi:Ca-activated chloride channel family protein